MRAKRVRGTDRVGARVTGVLVVLSLLAACASDPPPRQADLRFIDSKIFEKELQEAMKEETVVIEVGVTGKDATINDMPDRLEKWLYVINERDDGTVKFQPDTAFMTPKSPVPLGLVFSVGSAGWRMYRNWAHYAPASDYNALVFYHPTDAYLTRVVFVRKAED